MKNGEKLIMEFFSEKKEEVKEVNSSREGKKRVYQFIKRARCVEQ